MTELHPLFIRDRPAFLALPLMEPFDSSGGQTEDRQVLRIDPRRRFLPLLQRGLDRRGRNGMPVPFSGIGKKGFIPAQGHIFHDPPDGGPEFGIEDPAPFPDLLKIGFKIGIAGPYDFHALLYGDFRISQ